MAEFGTTRASFLLCGIARSQCCCGFLAATHAGSRNGDATTSLGRARVAGNVVIVVSNDLRAIINTEIALRRDTRSPCCCLRCAPASDDSRNGDASSSLLFGGVGRALNPEGALGSARGRVRKHMLHPQIRVKIKGNR